MKDNLFAKILQNKMIWIPVVLAVLLVVALMLLKKGDSQPHVYDPF